MGEAMALGNIGIAFSMQGDFSKAKKVLGWESKVKFKELVKIMLEADLKEAGLDPKQHLKI